MVVGALLRAGKAQRATAELGHLGDERQVHAGEHHVVRGADDAFVQRLVGAHERVEAAVVGLVVLGAQPVELAEFVVGRARAGEPCRGGLQPDPHLQELGEREALVEAPLDVLGRRVFRRRLAHERALAPHDLDDAQRGELAQGLAQ
ncbi:hypothetical protein DI005_33425 [Prauserella sp. PE36]|nr:hypothetical protein DI005_33425 [Prauserella sp. PE36]